MEKTELNIDDEIETGRYFKAALDWHTSRYLSYYTQCIYMFIVTLLALVAAIVAIHLTRARYSIEQYPLVSYTDDQVNYVTRIHSISHLGDSIDKSVARYMITAYIQSRESYKYEEYSNKESWDQKIAFLQSNSSKKVLSEFLNYMDTRQNPDSPVLKYKTQTRKDVSVKDVKFFEYYNRPFRATADFLITELSYNSTVVSKCTAELIFSLTDIEKVIDKSVALKFMVTSYSSSCNLHSS
ncbi:VirB8/TrbF family protein [Candidatus Lariskella endosymbiont of Hedychridium roseum]|uniref:VirB8/TrbF family protein n=1 Tax=Candidatus Lariskella endosymbiont of Hedychridium roseum TaxID=3077949 RepID=UPI0030D22CE7